MKKSEIIIKLKNDLDDRDNLIKDLKFKILNLTSKVEELQTSLNVYQPDSTSNKDFILLSKRNREMDDLYYNKNTYRIYKNIKNDNNKYHLSETKKYKCKSLDCSSQRRPHSLFCCKHKDEILYDSN